jgi:hypothetical protein
MNKLAPRSSLSNLVRQKPVSVSDRPRDDREVLFDETLSLDGAMSIVAGRQLRGSPAANSTVDALMYSLRSGVNALARNDVQPRIAMLDERQMHACCKELQHRNPDIAKSWTKDEIEKLVALWASCHG